MLCRLWLPPSLGVLLADLMASVAETNRVRRTDIQMVDKTDMKHKYFITLYFRYLYFEILLTTFYFYFLHLYFLLPMFSKCDRYFSFNTFGGIMGYIYFASKHAAFPTSQDWFQPISTYHTREKDNAKCHKRHNKTEIKREGDSNGERRHVSALYLYRPCSPLLIFVLFSHYLAVLGTLH